MFLSCRWINHSRIMTNKAPVMPPMPPDVRFRRATPRDQADIIALGATIQELDYMDYMYPFYISHPEYFSFCLEKEGQLICFAIMHVVDGGDTLVRFAGRTHATLRGKGYMEMLLAAADYFVCQHLTTAPFRRIYLSRAAAFQRELVKKSPAKFNVILSRQVLGRKTTKGEVSAIVASEDFQNSQNKYSTEVWVPTDEEIVALLSDQSTKQRLFPDDNFIAMFEPYRPTVANMTQARRTSKIFLSGIRRAASVRALSFVSEIAVHTGLSTMSTDSNSIPPLPPCVVFRPATPRDHTGIVKLTCGMFGELDYIPNMYPFYMTSGEHFCYLLERDGQILCFIYCYVVDDGETVLFGGGRTHPGHQGKGYIGMLGSMAQSDLTKRLVKKPSRSLYLAFDSAFHRDRAQNHPEIFKIITILNLLSRSATIAYMSALVRSHSFQLNEMRFTSEIWSPSEQEMAALLSDGATCDRLFPCGYFIAMLEPYIPTVSNVTLAQKRSKVFVSGDRGSGRTDAMSWTTHVQCEVGLRYHLGFFGNTALDFMQHFHKYAKNVLDLHLPEKTVVAINLHVPRHVDKTSIDTFLDDYLLKLGMFANNSGHILMETREYQHKL